MTQQNKTTRGWIVAAAVGAATGVLATLALLGTDDTGTNASVPEKRQPLYWQAPMNPDYRSDKPGKSPMGMDLIPVYADGNGATDTGPGTIKIAPEIVNNLGVRTAKAAKRSLHTAIRTVGYVQYDEDRLVHIHPRVAGWVEKLHVKAAGDPVTAGQSLYALYSPELVNAQEEYLLALKSSNNILIKAAKERLLALQLSGDFIQSLEKSRMVQQKVVFTAPQSGVVDNLNIREGFYVQPGTTLMSIGVLDEVWVQAEVFERQAELVTANMPVTMSLDYLPGREWHGSVDYIYPSLDEKTRTLRVRLRFANSDEALKPNMFVQVVLHSRNDKKALMVPREAVIRTGSQDRVVLALGDGRFKSLAVQLGRQDDDYIEILDGVQAGDTVVASAQFLLDSESSKTSDFKRMQAPNETVAARPASATVGGLVNRVDAETRTANISRDAIAKWHRAAMTMDFKVDPKLDITQLIPGQRTMFSFEVREGEFTITAIHTMDMSGGENDHD